MSKEIRRIIEEYAEACADIDQDVDAHNLSRAQGLKEHDDVTEQAIHEIKEAVINLIKQNE